LILTLVMPSGGSSDAQTALRLTPNGFALTF
jgi:hypothetical protein